MRGNLFLAVVGLLAVAFAGCSGDPPAGTLSSPQSDLSGEGTAEFTYDEASNPYQPADDPTEMIPFEELCALDAITSQDPTMTLQQCEDAGTEIVIHLMDLPAPTSEGYTAHLTGEAAADLGALQVEGEGENAMYTLEIGVEGTNLEGSINGTEIRTGGIVVARAGTSQGSNNFEINQALRAVGYEGTFTGRDLTVTVSGLPGGGSYEGWLVLVDAETGEKTHDVSFPVQNGENTFAAGQNIALWQEFHIHIAGSSVNLGISQIDAG